MKAIPFRPDCFFCRGGLKHTAVAHDHALDRFEGVLMRIRGGWYARPMEERDRELVRLMPDVRLSAVSKPERPQTKHRAR